LILAILLALEWIPPDPFDGLRTPGSRRPGSAWHEANRTAGVYLAMAGFFSLIAATAIQKSGWPKRTAHVVTAGLALFAGLAAIVRAKDV
jgi:hypothetical protein